MPAFELALTGQVLVFLIVIGVFLATGQASIFHPLAVYLGFHALVFVIRPMLVYCFGFDSIWAYMGFYPTEQQQIATLAISSTGLVIFSMSSIFAGWTKEQFKSATNPDFSIEQRRALLLTTILLAPIIAYSIHSLTHGGLQGEHIGGTFVLTGASGYTLEAQYMAGPLLCAWLAVTRFKVVAVAPTLFYMAYRSYMGWNRWTVILLFLGIALIYAWQKRTRWPPVWAALLVLPAFLLFHTLGENRDFFRQLLAGESVAREEAVAAPEIERLKAKYDSQEFANYDYLCFVTSMVPKRTGEYTYGSQYAQLFTEPIPRKLWPGKPAGAPIRSFNLNNYGNFLGLTPSLAGDGWMSGGWVGVIITLGLAGTLLGLAHRWFWRHCEENMRCLCYLIGVAMLPQWFRDGGISISKFLFWNLLPLLLWLAVTWVLRGGLVPGYSVLLPRHSRIRLIHLATKENPENPQTAHAPIHGHKPPATEVLS